MKPLSVPSVMLLSNVLGVNTEKFDINQSLIYIHIQGVTGGTDQTSGGCFLC